MHQLFTFATRGTLIVGVLLSLIAVSEILDLYLSLHQLSPFAGSLFAIVVLITVAGAAIYLAVQWYAHPPVLLAPPRGADLARDVQQHARYLARYLERLAENDLLAGVRADEARLAARQLTDAIDISPAELAARVRAVEDATAAPLLAIVRVQAEAEVRRCVRDVMAGVTLSPYRSSDLLVVLYRNGSMVLRLTALYGGRPRLSEQLAIVRDTLRVVAAVNFLNFGNKFLEGMLAGVPMLGRFADDVAQGIGAGFLTSGIGHAAMQRCEAFQGWERTAAVEAIGAGSKRFLADVRDVFFKDIYPSLRTRFPQSDVWDRLGVGVRSAFEATLASVDGFVTQPMLAGGRAVTRSGSGLRERFGRGRARAGVAMQRFTNRARARFERRRFDPPAPPSDPPPAG